MPKKAARMLHPKKHILVVMGIRHTITAVNVLEDDRIQIVCDDETFYRTKNAKMDILYIS